METDGIENRGAIELVKAQAKEKRKNFFIGTCCIAGLLLVGTICYQFIAREFSVDSLLSTILALFSVGISILFFFKADTSSAKFYDKVYEFNDTQKALLQEIRIVFSQKFEEILKLFYNKVDTESRVSEIEKKKETSTDSEIRKQLELELLNAKEELLNINKEISDLANIQNNLHYDFYRSSNSQEVNNILNRVSLNQIISALNEHKMDINELSNKGKKTLIDSGIMDSNGNITEYGCKKIAAFIRK